jgi:hypothetical protein
MLVVVVITCEVTITIKLELKGLAQQVDANVVGHLTSSIPAHAWFKSH